MLKYFVFTLPFLFFSSPSLADDYYISNENLQEDISVIRTFKSLITTELLKNKQDVVSSESESEWVLKPSLLKLQESYIVSITKYKDGKNYFSEKLKAQSLDDLDVVTTRLVEAVVFNKSVGSTQRVDNVTQDEVKGTTVKQKADKQFYFGFGPGAGSNLDTGKSGFSWTLGYLWGLEPNFSLRLNLEGVNIDDSGAGMTSLGIGAQYYFTSNKNSPYVMGALAYSWADSDLENPSSFISSNIDESGWAIQTGLGFQFFRTSTVNLGTEFYYTQGFYELVDGNPASYGFRVLLLW